jgi:DNA-binding transcriptional regulator LsrR (DeoR family)
MNLSTETTERRYIKTFYRNSNLRVAMEVRDLYFARVFKQAELGELYGLSQSTVCRMISGVVWVQ